jgi:hypothetical protein
LVLLRYCPRRYDKKEIVEALVHAFAMPRAALDCVSIPVEQPRRGSTPSSPPQWLRCLASEECGHQVVQGGPVQGNDQCTSLAVSPLPRTEVDVLAGADLATGDDQLPTS